MHVYDMINNYVLDANILGPILNNELMQRCACLCYTVTAIQLTSQGAVSKLRPAYLRDFGMQTAT